MNQLQIARQIKYLIESDSWSGGSQTVQAIISSMPMRDILRVHERLPVAVVRLGSQTFDPDFPEIALNIGISVEIAQRVDNDSYGEANIKGGARPSLLVSAGRGLGEISSQIIQAIKKNEPNTGISFHSRIESSSAYSHSEYPPYAIHTIQLSAKGGIDPYYHPARLISNSSGTLSWTLPPDRFDRYEVILRYAAGSTAPSSVTAGSGATLSGVLATSYTHGADGQGSGTFSYALFAGYDVTGIPGSLTSSDFYSDSITITDSF